MSEPLCTKCGTHPRRGPRQRWCRSCHNAAMKVARARQVERFKEMETLLRSTSMVSRGTSPVVHR